MAWKTNFAWSNETHERDLLEKYGLCCETPCLAACYSINDNDEDIEGVFINYFCAICGATLYPTDKISSKPGVWQ